MLFAARTSCCGVVVVSILDEVLVGTADGVENVPVVEVELKRVETTDQVQGRVRHLHEQHPLKLNLLLCITCSLDQCCPEHFDHLTIGDDDPLLIKRILVHFQLIHTRDVRLLQAVCQGQCIILVEEVDQRALLRLLGAATWAVGLHDADAVLFDEHSELHVGRANGHLNLLDRERPEDILDVG